MQPELAQAAESFSRHDFDATLPHLSDDVTWVTINGPRLTGKEAVAEACRGSAEYLAGVTTTFTRFRVVVGEDAVVTESLAEYAAPGEASSVIASCDVYDVTDGAISAITSYTVSVDA